ncbi:hypothetical protein ABB37_04322 [Leptomonas pyrrhocoris]|uniref:Uncharacterized protein n=1 Tax=Leptomonas pyrrhocoris TaxID=157538 RepID=A0A0N0DVV7_LEPPY|nr:hypothetical protein ABB37_04322 [Leptomonas pyrrhocoris]KPA80922.1 hypothetical protein ABB37_04322 [Leptomonas pyrrhocoris]|eukprot:XP_015659361.1 hypothetical protein ABB37_04322 [Leptomonas pyrrhocoris]
MLISGAEAAHQPLALSGAVTDDGQSVRQPNLNLTVNGAGSEAATTSFRNIGTVGGGTNSSQRRSNLVLFVKSNDNESDGQSRGGNNNSMPSQQSGGANSSNNSLAGKEDGEEGEQEDALSLAVSTATSGASAVMNAVAGATRKPLLTAAIVLLYFILLDIVLLKENERLNRILRRVRATDNDALVLLSASLVRQRKDAKKELHETLAGNDAPATLERLEMIQHRALALEGVCNRSIARLHMQLMFPGSVDDLSFLIEEHVAYDAQLQQLAADELDWVHTVVSSSVVRMSDNVPAWQRFRLGSRAAAFGASAGSASGDNKERGSSTGEDGEESEADTESNPLQNVYLLRAKEPAGSNGAAAAAAAARRTARSKSKGAQREEEETAAGDVLSLFKNRFFAFVLICVLLAAVLRMG